MQSSCNLDVGYMAYKKKVEFRIKLRFQFFWFDPLITGFNPDAEMKMKQLFIIIYNDVVKIIIKFKNI